MCCRCCNVLRLLSERTSCNGHLPTALPTAGFTVHMLQCVIAVCRVLQCVAMCCVSWVKEQVVTDTYQPPALLCICCNVLLQCVAVCCNVLQCVAVCGVSYVNEQAITDIQHTAGCTIRALQRVVAVCCMCCRILHLLRERARCNGHLTNRRLYSACAAVCCCSVLQCVEVWGISWAKPHVCISYHISNLSFAKWHT